MRMYSGSAIVVAKKKSFRSADMKRAPRWASEMVLLRVSLVSTKDAAGEPASDAHRGARFMSADLKDFFLATTMAEPEYMRIHYRYFPQEIREQCNLESKVAADGYIYVKIKKGMYGLKQVAVLAYDQLVEHLAPHGYYPCPQTTGIWQHATCPTRFCLCVDDF